MTSNPYTEATLVQELTSKLLESELGWESVFAQNEDFGKDSLLGRANDSQTVLTRPLRKALERLNPNLPPSAYDDAVRTLTEVNDAETALQANYSKYKLVRDRVKVTYKDAKSQSITKQLTVIDFENPENNDFLCVREFWVRSPIYKRRRADIVLFVNGLPLVQMELKNLHKDLRSAYEENVAIYTRQIPQLYHHNAFCILANGIDARIGAFSSPFEFYREWKRLDEGDKGVVNMETLLRGVCSKKNLIDIYENFILFDQSGGGLVKIVAQNQQYLGVNKAIEAVRNKEKNNGKLGVFWHTQGSGKSYSMVFFTRKVLRKLGGSYTFVVITDRDDLDSQIYHTFVGCGSVAKNDDDSGNRASSHVHLKDMLKSNKDYIFTLIQKFNKRVEAPYSDRSDIIVISDEAHRTQYGTLALNMRKALPNASYIGFTGTPLFKKEDQLTRDVFGDYVSTYDFQRAVEDGATVPLYYDARGEMLHVVRDDLNDLIAQRLEEFEREAIDDPKRADITERLEKELKREYHIITAEKRLDQIARDFVEHYSTAWESGKAMFVCIDKLTCVRMHGLVGKYWIEKIAKTEKELTKATSAEQLAELQRKLAWMKETVMAVVVSEEQGEIEKFSKWGYDFTPQRKLLVDGFMEGKDRVDVETAFRRDNHPFRVAFVCAMWLTGFDVKSLSTLYLDKPLKAHTLMQAIARANRVSEGKTNGLIVDYCGILKHLREALAVFATSRGTGASEEDSKPEEPAKPARESLLQALDEICTEIRVHLHQWGFDIDTLTSMKELDFKFNAGFAQAKDAINTNDQTRKKFGILARELFNRFKASLNVTPEIYGYQDFRRIVNLLYSSLTKDRDNADIDGILKDLQSIVDSAIDTKEMVVKSPPALYNVAKIDFVKLKAEFEKTPNKKSTVQNLKDAIEKRLSLMIAKNASRDRFQQAFEKIVMDYNKEKDRLTIEQTFEALLVLVNELNEEEQRAVRNGLTEESQALYDLLLKPDINSEDIKQVKKVASDLLTEVKSELNRIHDWYKFENTRAEVKVYIHNKLWDDKQGLPPSYSQEEVETKVDALFTHFLTKYPTADPVWMGMAG